MPDGKPDIDEDLEDDPFDGIELAEDAPEPTQEEMDEWATLDTPDEDVSPRLGARSESPTEPVAPSTEPVAPVSSDDKEEKAVSSLTEEEKEQQSDKAKDTPPTSVAALEAKAQVLPAAAEPQAKGEAAPVPPVPTIEVKRATELSEITPAASPVPPKPAAKEQALAPAGSASADYDDDGEEDAGEDSELLQQRQLQQQSSQRSSAGGGWGVGWGGSWGLGALGGKLREVAAGAVRDVKDLTETFQAALADVTGAEDEVEQARRISAMDRAAEAEAEAAAGHAAKPETDDADGGPSAPTDAPRQAAEPERESGGGAAAIVGRAASRGARGSSVGGAAESSGAPADPALEAGLQAIDAQVEQLATGAARAFHSLWGGLSSVAKVVAAEVAASVADVQSSEAVRGVAQIGTKLAHTAERGLETVGRTAMVLLEEVAGVGAAQAGRRRIWGEEADARAADMGREPSSFQDFFYIYGGEQLAEEVNNLSNECSHLCNKSRSKLEGDQQKALDEALGRLGPYFNDPWVGHKAAEGGKDGGEEGAPAGALPELEAGSKEAADRLGQMYDPIGYLCQDSLSRSEAFMHQLLEAMEAARTAQPGERVSKERPEGEEPTDEEAEDEEAALLRRRAEPRVLLESFRVHFTKRQAEVTTAQLQLLLNLGASLAAPARTGRPAADGIDWPDNSEQQAALLAGEARRMVTDLDAITAAYCATIDALRAPSAPSDTAEVAADEGVPGKPTEVEVDAAAEKQEVEPDAAESASASAPQAATTIVDGKVLDEMTAALAANSVSATASIKSGYKGLLYAVLLRSLVTQIAQQREDEGEAPEPEPEAVEGGDAAEDVAKATTAAQ